MKTHPIKLALLSLVAVIHSAHAADLPGKGLAQHDFLYAGEAKARDIYIVRGGEVKWSYHDPAGRGEISDAVMLSNGNILYAHQMAVKLITPEKKVIWNYDAPPNCEIHTAQPIGTERVIFIQNGPEPKLLVANITTGKIERELPLEVKNPQKTHPQFRHARLTPAGTYLVAHMDRNEIIEYDETGKSIWSVKVPFAWSAERLANGNTLVCGKGVQEYDPAGKLVWELTPADVKGYKFNSTQIAQRLPNGNTLVNNWTSQWAKPDATPTTDLEIQALEVTPDKKIVWVLSSWETPNLGPSTTIQLLDTPSIPENVHFGSIR